MAPSSRLNQGTFEDTDLLLADNFARAAEAQHLKHIVFIGGIFPRTLLPFQHIYAAGLKLSKPLNRAVHQSRPFAQESSLDLAVHLSILSKNLQSGSHMACPDVVQIAIAAYRSSDMLQIIDKSIGEEAYYS